MGMFSGWALSSVIEQECKAVFLTTVSAQRFPLNYLSFCFLMTTFSVQLLFLWGFAWLPRLSNICPGSNRLLLATGCPLATHIMTWICKTKEAELESIKMFTQSPLVSWQTRVRARLIWGLLSWSSLLASSRWVRPATSLLHPSGTGPSAKQVLSLWFRKIFRVNPTEYTHPVTSLHGIWMFSAFLREGKKGCWIRDPISPKSFSQGVQQWDLVPLQSPTCMLLGYWWSWFLAHADQGVVWTCSGSHGGSMDTSTLG